MNAFFRGAAGGLLMLCLAFAARPFAAADAARYEPQRASFTITVSGVTTDQSIISTTAMPGSELRIMAEAAASADSGALRLEGGVWIWTAPQTPGLASLSFEYGGEIIDLNVFVLTPFSNGAADTLNGYKVGKYASTPFRGLSTYRAPTGFIEVTPAMREVRVSPHFKLGQFLCKQQPGHDPTYVLILPAMLTKLEALLEAVNDAGHDVPTLTVMSGFRTPWYNASIGNRTTSSRHLFGGAADVYVDADGDGWMDDLNGDGKIDKADAHYLAAMAEELSKAGAKGGWPAGGVGVYSANAVHGPFVHVDARGYRARW